MHPDTGISQSDHLMKKRVLFIQGAGAGAYDMDEKLVASLRSALGLDYEVSYPRMPGEGDPVYFVWKPAISAAIVVAGDGATLVGHSVGGASLLKYLVEEPLTQRIAGLFLIAAPAWDGGQWAFEDLRLPEDAASRLKPIERIHFYHCQDDTTVPFAHLALHAQRIPQANTHAFQGRGHQFDNDLSFVANDILNTVD